MLKSKGLIDTTVEEEHVLYALTPFWITSNKPRVEQNLIFRIFVEPILEGLQYTPSLLSGAQLICVTAVCFFQPKTITETSECFQREHLYLK